MIVCLLSRQISLCKNATGNLSFLWEKETIFIYVTIIIFVVYERKQSWSPQTTPHQFLAEIWAIVLEVNSLTLVVGLVDSSLISFLLKLIQRGLASISREN